MVTSPGCHLMDPTLSQGDVAARLDWFASNMELSNTPQVGLVVIAGYGPLAGHHIRKYILKM
ncbi:hypothetical protein [Actinoplanes sp. L3-i22]|uniref:hypothetical protein n=1 Tax=Actinoplanes sp. L3-i22 TaxID=2836373 RepID=UPI001C8510E3|nr:hypothetical protein [Actinoplanes sp. L3-i22]